MQEFELDLRIPRADPLASRETRIQQDMIHLDFPSTILLYRRLLCLIHVTVTLCHSRQKRGRRSAREAVFYPTEHHPLS
jgi:hypothetical protein